MKAVPLGEVAEIVSGATPKTGDENFWGGRILWATPADLSKLDGPYIGSTPRTITEAGLKSCAAQVLPAGSVLLSSRAPIGHVAINTEPMATNQGFKSLIPKPGVADAKYLYHWLRANTSYLQSLGNGATFKEISKAVVSKVEVPLPPLDEQRRVAAILDQADGLRVKRRQVRRNLDDLARAFFVDMFGDPIRNPMGFPLVALGELGELDRGVSRHRPRNDPALLGGPYPLIQTGDVTRSGGRITEYSATYSELGLAQSKLWPAGTLCITIAANIAQTGVLTFNACFPDSVVGFTADKAMTTYVSVWLNFLQPVLEASAPQSAQRNINLAILRALLVPLPERRQLDHFDEIIDRVQHQQQLNEDVLVHDETLFDSIQTRAFAGQL